MSEKFQSEACRSVYCSAAALLDIRAISEATMQEFHATCIDDVNSVNESIPPDLEELGPV